MIIGGVQKLFVNFLLHKRTKHINVKYHFLRDVVTKERVKIEYLEMEEMPANVLTKSLLNVKKGEFINELGIMRVVYSI